MSTKQITIEVHNFQLTPGQTVLDVLQVSGLVATSSEGRRTVAQKAVQLDGVTLLDPDQLFPHAGVLQVGKTRFVHVHKNAPDPDTLRAAAPELLEACQLVINLVETGMHTVEFARLLNTLTVNKLRPAVDKAIGTSNG